MKESFYYVENIRSDKADFNASIERYSDRYSKMKKADLNKWKPGEAQHWSCFKRLMRLEYSKIFFN